MIEAGKCYATQFTPEEMQEMLNLVTQDTSNTKYFRRFVISQESREEFWD